MVEIRESAAGEGTRERFIRIVRRKLAERGYAGETLETKLNEITSKEDINFSIDWEKVMGPSSKKL
jgi:hypothetical protein